MTIAIARMNELATRYGDEGLCITSGSALEAAHDDLTQETDLASWDVEWLYNNPGYCVGTTPPPIEIVLQTAVVDRILDADTLDVFVCPGNVCELAPLTTRRIRLWHVSGPSDDYPSGIEATEWLQEMLPVGSEISFENKGQDPYDRILGIVYDENNNNINELLIATGFATPWTAEELLEWEEYVGDVVVEPPPEPEPPVDASARFTGNTELPYSIKIGEDNWVGGEFENIGTVSGRWWIGVRLVDENDVEWTFTGIPDYATEILPGEIKMLWCSFVPPDTLHGTIGIHILLNKRGD